MLNSSSFNAKSVAQGIGRTKQQATRRMIIKLMSVTAYKFSNAGLSTLYM